MQLNYNRQPKIGSSLMKFLVKIILAIILIVIVFFLIEKINFPSPQKKYDTDITNDIKKL
tara:strand:+ start:57 stop:236 length:180 start_codon:yes stop_codon:yes gene_type:complete